MEKITEMMNIGEILEIKPELEDVFLKHGLNCVGCPGSSVETVAEAAEGHGVNLAELLEDLNNEL